LTNRLAQVIHRVLGSSLLFFVALGHASGQAPPPVSFSAPVDMLVGQGPVGVVSTDLNSDDKLDLITVNNVGSNVSVLLGNGDGTFQAAVNYPVLPTPTAIVTGDFDGDARVDVAVFNVGSTSSPSVSILLGNGDGTLQPPIRTQILGALSSAEFVAGDFNHDGKLDLAVAAMGPQIGLFSVALLQGKGDGTFNAPVYMGLSVQPQSIQSADFNGDGKLDLLVTSFATTTVAVLLGNGDGTFQPPLNSSPVMADFSSIGSAAIADFNHDGRLDVVFCGSSSEIWELPGNGDGTFQNAVETVVPLPLQATRLAVADLNSDGNPDLVVVDLNGTIQAFTGNGDGTFSPGESFVPSYLGATAVGDFNNDGVSDLALAGTGPAVGFNIAGVSVVLGTGDGTFVLATPHTIPISSKDRFTTVISGDFDGDGLPDLAGYFSPNTGQATLEGVAVLLSGTGLQTAKVTNLTSQQSFPPTYAAVAADFNGDGKLDMAVGSGAVLLGKGDGTFQPEVDYPLGTPLAVGDFNNDSKPDLIGINSGSGSVSVLLGKGDGTFGFPMNSPAGNVGGAGGLAVGDFNQDGKLDAVMLASSGTGQAGFSVLLGNGDGTFQMPLFADIGFNPTFISATDMNGDGKLDLVITNSSGANSSPDTVSVLLGKGDGTFQMPITMSAGNGISWLLVSDLNGDGKPDVVIGNSSRDVSILVGKGDGTLQLPLVSFATGAYGPIAAADFNGDGSIDLAAAPFDGGPLNTIYVLLNDSSGRAASLAPTTIAFGTQTVGGTSSAQSVTLSNKGTSAITIKTITFSGPQSADFHQTNNCGASLGAAATCSVSITFSPSAAGSRTASLQIVDDAFNTPQTAALSGTGGAADFGLAVASGSSASATVKAGGTAAYTLAIGGTGFGGTATLTCTGAPAHANCSVPATVTVGAVTASNFAVSVTTTAPGAATLHPWRTLSPWLWAMVLFGIILPSKGLGRRSTSRRIRMMPVVLLLFLCSCGDGSSGSQPNSNGTPAGTYTINVKATSGSLSQSIPLTLIVQ
jgi:hypothetical protein